MAFSGIGYRDLSIGGIMAEIYLEDFDQGCMDMLEATLMDVVIDQIPRQEYVVTVAGIEGPKEFQKKIPVYFAGGNQNFSPAFYPCIVINRTDIEEDDSRKFGWNLESVKPSPFANTVTLVDAWGNEHTGVDKKREKKRSVPYIIPYEIQVMARGGKARREAQKIFRHVLSIFTPDDLTFAAKDSDGDEREYDAKVEIQSQDVNYLDLTMREYKCVLTCRVSGEIDFYTPVDKPTAFASPTLTAR